MGGRGRRRRRRQGESVPTKGRCRLGVNCGESGLQPASFVVVSLPEVFVWKQTPIDVHTGEKNVALTHKSSRKPQRFRDPDTNPCLVEGDASNKCLIEANFDRDMCGMHVLRYKNCRKFWTAVMRQRRRDGINPILPTAEERENILASMGKMPY
ncbi:hypothetical protein JRQ81_012746 [Phrynocephalus forsythii]|uniref:Coiled-coil-helix-coiled-coil-helix domain-containing protein 7 n=1 Tax=Phrynocephalus forsythii TaxID=171643 RepID=A0A9Q1B585_9SAUR|nr:hypothetical protein JRQ81_012746 [Phrynocephalus forsythii]